MKYPALFSSLKQAYFRHLSACFIAVLLCSPSLIAQTSYISTSAKEGYFPLVSKKAISKIYVDPDDFKGVLRVAGDLTKDIERITGRVPLLNVQRKIKPGTPVIIGTLEKSRLVDDLVEKNKLHVSGIRGK
jgi:hypothetical protein